MLVGEYIGTIEHLRGKTALIEPGPGDVGVVLAQFNDALATKSGKEIGREPRADALGFGWHEFAAKDFDIKDVGSTK
jgi:hypothetical protein